MSTDPLGWVPEEQGKFTEAENIWRQRLEISRRHLGEEHGGTCSMRGHLGGLLRRQGNLDEAEKFRQRTLNSL